MTEVIAGIILAVVLVIFTLGKSPLFRIDRAGSAWIGAVMMMACGILSFDEAVRAVDFRTIVILFSMMVVVANLKIAGFFSFLGCYIINKVNSKKALLGVVILLSGVLSALAINDIVCLLFTPVVIFICQKSECEPVPHLLALALCSNIGSAATFLGNPQNILIGSLSQIPFGTYLKTALPIALLGMLLTYILLSWRYRDSLKGNIAKPDLPDIYYHKYLIAKTLATLILIIGGYIAGFDIAILASLGAAFLLITRRVKPNRIYTSIDFNLLLIFIGLFIVIGGVKSSGLLALIEGYLPAEALQDISLFAIVSVVLSNIVSNVPAVLLLQYYILPQEALVKWQELALLSTIAGNLTIFGSIANLIVVETAKKSNINISAREYFIVGFPLTIVLMIICIGWLKLLF